MSGKQFLSPKEVEDILGVSASTISRRVKDHTIPAVAFGGMLLIPASFIRDLEERAMDNLKPSKGPDGGSRS